MANKFILYIIITFLLCSRNIIAQNTERSSDLDKSVSSYNNVFKDNPNLHQIAPDFKSKTISGEVFQLSSTTSKVVLINFWIRGCPSCIKEMSDLNRIRKEYEDKAVTMLSIYVSPEENLDKNVEVDFPLIANAKDIAETYGVKYFPQTFIIDKSKKITDILPYVVMRSTNDPDYNFKLLKRHIEKNL